jgi:hypothetical protein
LWVAVDAASGYTFGRSAEMHLSRGEQAESRRTPRAVRPLLPGRHGSAIGFEEEIGAILSSGRVVFLGGSQRALHPT